MTTLTLQRETLEQLEVTITTDVTITGDVVEFAVSSTTGRPVVWVAGSWHPTKAGVALTPTIGAAGALAVTPGRWLLWCRITDTPEHPVLSCGAILVA